MPVFLVGIRLVPAHRTKIRQYPFNGIPHGVELRVLEHVGEVQVDRNIAATDIQRPIWVADFRTHAETCPCVVVCFAAYSYNPFQKLRRSEILLPTYRNSFKVYVIK